MLSCKKILTILFTGFVFTGCMERTISFSFYNYNETNKNKDREADADVFKEIPGLGSAKYLDHPVTKKANKIEMYVSTFRERYIEKDHLLEFSELNDDSKIPHADYLSVDGYSQDLYILKYKFTYQAGSSDVPVDAAIFFSVKYNGKGDTLGVTPCYFGIIDSDANVIAFDTQLSLKKDGDNFYFKLHKKKKNMNGLLFIPANFPEKPSAARTKLNIEKIVKLDPGKVGGYKPLVFDIAKIFRDPTALQFHYEMSLHLKQ